MKKIILSLILLPFLASGQTNVWMNNTNSERAFVENKGQYDGRNWQSNNPIKFGLSQQDGWFTFFTEKGITHRIESLVRNPNKKKGEGDESIKFPSRVHTSELIDVTFINSNPNVQLIAEDKTDFYFSYAIKNPTTKEVTNFSHIDGYKKITYKNIYNKIDIEYTLHPDGGIKYNFILHSGADPSQIKMKYTPSHTTVKDENIAIQLLATGELEIATSKTKIIEHKPISFYKNSSVAIASKFNFNNNILTFELENYDNTQEVIIDPWVVIPAFNAGDFTREVETDGAGNVYVIGGEIPMELRKYNSAGVFQWTYVTPWDTTGGDWLGTLATDAAGVSYITQGTGPELERISTAGAMVWHNNAPFLHEYWTITFNCDNTKLIVAGTDVIPFAYEATIWDIDLNNGNQMTSVQVGTQAGFTPVEVRSIAPTKNSKYVYLTHTEVGLINQNLTACSSAPDFEVDNNHHLAYKCENYLSASQNGGGLKALIANDNYFYTHRGDQIRQWDITTGALLNTVALPGGNSNTDIFGDRVVSCSGLDVDAAGNVYAGSMDRVVKFDPNLNILSSSFTTGGFDVYDVSVNANGEVLAVGALLNNSTATGRGGRIESLNMTAGAQYTTVCCDPNFCPVGPLCDNGTAVNLAPNTLGGTWSSVPVTAGLNTSTGVFDPTVAGIGTYTITYTLACGTNSIVVQVGNCSAMSVCVEANGDLTVTGGNGPYTWNEWVPAASTPITNSAQCTACGGTWTFGSCFNPFPIPLNSCATPAGWSYYGTGVTVTPPVGADTIQIVDGLGNTLEIYNVSALPPCSGCDATITQAGPFCVNTAASNLTAAQTGGVWSGTGITNATNGTFNPSTAGAGSFVITYTLPTCTDTMTIVVNPLPNAGTNGTISLCATSPSTNLFNQLGGSPNVGGTWSPVMASGTGVFNPAVDAAGTYTYTVTNSCGTSNSNVIVTIIANPTPGTNGTLTICVNAASTDLFNQLGGSPSVGGTWSPAMASGTGVFNPAVDAAGTYTYSINDCLGNPQSSTVVVTVTPLPNTGTNGTISLCPTDPATDLFNQLGGSPNVGGTWSPVLTSGTGMFDPAVDAAGTYTYSITNSCGTSSNNVIVTITSNPSPGTNGTLTICANAASTDLFNQLGGSPSAGGTWSPVLTSGTGIFNPAVDAAGTYTYTIIDCAGSSLTADVVVTVNPAPNAGTNGAISLCNTDPATNLFNQLGGSPDVGGTWSPVLTSGTGMFDPAVDAAGTYTYSVTNSCGTATSNVIVTITSCTLPTAGYTVSDSIICEGDCINFTNTSSGATSWLWTFNGGSPSTSTSASPSNICFNSAGNFTIEQIVTNSNGSDTTTSTVVVNATPIIDAGPDVTIELGQSTTLTATGTNGVYTWSPFTWLDCAICVSPISTPEETITYTVIVVDSNGCSASDQVTVIVDFDNVIFVPNIFSPNGDGFNDILYVRGQGVALLNFFIYDRWGEKVFETTTLDKGWDGTFRGKKMNNAVFVYYLQATFIDGSEATQKGDITLVR